MKVLSFWMLLISFAACAALPTKGAPPKPEEKKAVAEEKPAPPPPQIEIRAVTAPLATIDSATLKVTYKKGADLKVVVDEVVKNWAQATTALQACQGEVNRLHQEKEKSK